MDLIDKKTSIKTNRMVAWYNMIPNLFWSIICLTPISVYCYQLMNSTIFFTLLASSLLSFLLPNSFYNFIQLGKTTKIYKRLGVRFINKFTQNGTIINGLIKKKITDYKIISKRNLSIKKLINQTYMFEKFHFMMFLFFLQTTIYALINSYFMWAFIITITNLIYNIYPNLLQQYIRIKLTSVNKNNSQL